MSNRNQAADARPLVVITGAAGGIGSSLARALLADYRVVGIDRMQADSGDFEVIEADLTSDESSHTHITELRRAGRHFSWRRLAGDAGQLQQVRR